MVMIPKPKTDHSSTKRWQPIVLANTCSKLVEKCVAKLLQGLTALLHELQYGSRMGRSAVDALMILVSKAETAM